MPVTYKIDPAKKLIHTRCIGDVNPKEVSEHFRELESDPYRPDRLNVLLDLTEMTSLPITQELRGVSHDLRQVRGKLQFGACAIITSNDALFGMMRMFQVLAEEYFAVTRVFKKIKEAQAWLEYYKSDSGPGE
jgi:hypothetical protein